MFGFRKCTRVHLMSILSLQGVLQNQNLETILICIVVLCFPHNNIAWIHMCHECTRSNAPNVCHKLESILWSHERVRSLTIKYQDYQYEPTTDISEQFVSKLLRILQAILFLLLIGGPQGTVLRLCVVVALSESPVHNTFPRTSVHALPYHRTMKKQWSHQVSLKLWFLVVFLPLQQKSVQPK